MIVSNLHELINEAARVESEKDFHVRSGNPEIDTLDLTTERQRTNRTEETYNTLRAQLHQLDRAIANHDVALFANRRVLTHADLGKGIRDIVIIPANSPDPDYPANTGEMDASHGGILRSSRVEVVIDTEGRLGRTLLPGAEVDDLPDSPLQIPLYTAINFVSDPNRVNTQDLPPYSLPYVAREQLHVHGTLLTIGGSAVAAHHAAISDALAQLS